MRNKKVVVVFWMRKLMIFSYAQILIWREDDFDWNELVAIQIWDI